MSASIDCTKKWTIERSHEKPTGWRGIGIKDERGIFVANIVMQLDDSEMKIARRIVDAVNATLIENIQEKS